MGYAGACEYYTAGYQNGIKLPERILMGKNLEKAKVIRNDPDVHYNCAQALLCAFAEDCGLTQEQACGIGANFGSGMKMAGTCGAVTSALMVLGLKGIDDGPTIAAFQRAIRDNHDGCLDCADLLRMNKERGGERKPHCDGMVYEAAELVEKILEERGKEA
jgi:hypothetical protein